MPSIVSLQLGKGVPGLALGLLLLGIAASGLTGCAEGPYLPKVSRQDPAVDTAPFVLMDRAVQNSVTCVNLRKERTADGRLRVVAGVKNLLGRRIQVQVRCVFKDEFNSATGDTSPWQDLILGEFATESVEYYSLNASAASFTISVRQAR